MLLHLTFSLISDLYYDIPARYYVSALLFLKCSVWNIQLLNTLNIHERLFMNSQSYMNSQAVIDCVLHSIFTYCIS